MSGTVKAAAAALQSAGKQRDPYPIFCVCKDPDVINMAAACSNNVQGFFFAGAFADYITAERRPQFPPSVKMTSKCVALIDFDADPEAALRTAERLNQIFSYGIHLVAVGSEIDSSMLLRAVRAGCVECLRKPLRPVEFEDALNRFLQHMRITQTEENRNGKVLTFFGAKGGVGTTTLAVHLALHLSQTHGCKTLIIDHKHQLGHVALYLGLHNAQYHFDELLRNVDRLDTDLLRGYAVTHKSGLDVLASPDYSNEQFMCSQGELESVMNFLRREYDYVLIDSSVGYESSNFSIASQSDKVFLVSTADVASLRDLARLVEHMKQNHSAEDSLSLVINRATSNQSITPEQIREAMHTGVKLSVPNNFMELLTAVNNGEPIPVNSTSSFSTAIASWAVELAGGMEDGAAPQPAVQKAKRSFSFGFGSKGGTKWLKPQYS